MTKDELLEIPELVRKTDRMAEHLDELRAAAESVRAVDTSEERTTRSDARRSMAVADKVIDLEREIRKSEKQIDQRRESARKLFLQNLDGLEREVMMLRYCDCVKWEAVAEVSGYDLRYVHRLHRSALNKLFGHGMPC